MPSNPTPTVAAPTVDRKLFSLDEANRSLTYLEPIVAVSGLADNGARLYVGDRSIVNPGIVVIDPSDHSIVGGPIPVGLPPSDLVYIDPRN